MINGIGYDDRMIGKKYISQWQEFVIIIIVFFFDRPSAYKLEPSRFVIKASNILYGYRNVELMYECCPQHLRIRTATMK